MFLTTLIFALSVQARTSAHIEDHYFGATLFVVQTGNTVWPPVGVTNLAEYESTYGRTSGQAVDHGYQAARLFFANGGQTLYVIDPQGTTAQDFADTLTASLGLPVDLVAIPGAACCSDSLMQHAGIMSALRQHVDASPNRFGLIDAPLDSNASALLAYRTAFSSEHAALYAPWLVLNNPESGNNVTVPPSSAVAGVISRIDRQDGIYKAPAGTRANLDTPPVTDIEREFSPAEQEALKVANVNLLGKFVSPLIIHVWGARTTSTVYARHYVSVARFLRHLEFSMNRSLAEIVGTSPNDPDPAIVRGLLQSYLYGYWQQGALKGTHPDQAYFVSCTVAPLVVSCTIAVSVLKPAEFEVFQLSIPYGDVIFASGFEANELVRAEIQATAVTACVPHLPC